MKSTNKKQPTVDPIAEARKDKNFSLYAKESRVNIRLAVEVYKKRKEKGWSQARLAEEISTTQKVISKIESGDVDIGIGLLKRLTDGLLLTTKNIGMIFESCCDLSDYNITPHQDATTKHEDIDITEKTITI